MTAERVYTRLLAMYSPAFRLEYHDEMLEAFRELHGVRSHNPLTFWAFIIGDLVCSAARERFISCSALPKRPEIEWLMLCVSGAIAIAGAAHALSWTFSYFYHPYLEGLAIPAWAYGAVLGSGLGVVQSTKLERGLRSRARLTLATSVASAVGLQVVVSFGEPATYGTLLGGFVGGVQWLVFADGYRRTATWVLSSVTAMVLAVGASAGAMLSTLRGLNPRASDLPVFDIDRLLNTTLPLPLSMPNVAVMSICGLMSAILTARLLTTMHAKGRSC
jgi:hypothetical protein